MSVWKRVSKTSPCPICGKPDWCLITADQSAAICQRQSEGSVKMVGESGWLHRLRDSDDWRSRRTRRVTISCHNPQDLGELAKKYEDAASDNAVSGEAFELGLDRKSLRRLHIGRDGSTATFPMVDADGKVIGIRLRLADGRKLSVRGGKEGLFVPIGVDKPNRLLICEGPTDTAALISAGFDAIGRPSCSGGVRLIVDLVRRWRPGEVVIVADGDEPGRLGATRLAKRLALHVSTVKVIVPPEQIKDARAWFCRHWRGFRAAVFAAIETAKPIRLNIKATRRLR